MKMLEIARQVPFLLTLPTLIWPISLTREVKEIGKGHVRWHWILVLHWPRGMQWYSLFGLSQKDSALSQPASEQMYTALLMQPWNLYIFGAPLIHNFIHYHYDLHFVYWPFMMKKKFSLFWICCLCFFQYHHSVKWVTTIENGGWTSINDPSCKEMKRTVG